MTTINRFAGNLDGLDRIRLGLQRPNETEVQPSVEDGIDLLIGRHLLQN